MRRKGSPATRSGISGWKCVTGRSRVARPPQEWRREQHQFRATSEFPSKSKLEPHFAQPCLEPSRDAACLASSA